MTRVTPFKGDCQPLFNGATLAANACPVFVMLTERSNLNCFGSNLDEFHSVGGESGTVEKRLQLLSSSVDVFFARCW